MKLRFLWPGKTINPDIRGLQEEYLKKIIRLHKCEVNETPTAKGLKEKYGTKIREIETKGLEKNIKDDYIICLSDKGKEMSSEKFAQLLEHLSTASPKPIAFVCGGFLGLQESVLNKSDLLLSFSKMTFSHELSRVILLEQVYRALTMIKGRQYAK